MIICCIPHCYIVRDAGQDIISLVRREIVEIMYNAQFFTLALRYQPVQQFIEHSLLNKRHLNRKHSAVIKIAHKLGEKALMIGYSMQAGV